MKLLKLIRFPNLLMIALTQYLVRMTIIVPILSVYSLPSSLSDFNFFLLVISTMMIAAGGYIINDYHDVAIDRINNPGKWNRSDALQKKSWMNQYLVFSCTGVGIGFYLSLAQHIPNAWLMNLLSVALLWTYSTSVKRIFLAGNLLIAFLTSLSILLLLLTDLNSRHGNIISALVMGYAVFAFVMTWIREIIKDIEDVEGDREFGRKTLPVVIGQKASKAVASVLMVGVTAALVWMQYIHSQWDDMISFLYVIAAIEMPLIALLVFLFRANEKNDFSRLSFLTKIIMLMGVLSMLVFFLRYK